MVNAGCIQFGKVAIEIIGNELSLVENVLTFGEHVAAVDDNFGFEVSCDLNEASVFCPVSVQVCNKNHFHEIIFLLKFYDCLIAATILGSISAKTSCISVFVSIFPLTVIISFSIVIIFASI